VEHLGQEHLQVVHRGLVALVEWEDFGGLHQAEEAVEATMVVAEEEMTDAAPARMVAVAVAADLV
jgi:hypothetical protein